MQCGKNMSAPPKKHANALIARRRTTRPGLGRQSLAIWGEAPNESIETKNLHGGYVDRR